MLTPPAMRHVDLYLLREDSQAAVLELASEGLFDPAAVQAEAALPDRPAAVHRKAFLATQQMLNRILAYLNLSWPGRPEPLRVVSVAELRQLEQRLRAIWRDCAANEERERHLQEEKKRLGQLQTVLRHYQNLDADLGLLQHRLCFLDVRIGTVPARSLRRLQRAVRVEPYTLNVYLRSEDTVHVTLAGLAGREERVDNVLRAASFRPLELPGEFRDRPEQVRRELAERADALEENGAGVRRNIDQLREQHGNFLHAAAETIMLAAPYAALGDTMAGRGEVVYLAGWVPKRRVKALEAALQRIGAGVIWEIRDPDRSEWTQVPSATRHPRWVRAFGRLVHNYGIPRYGEIDPTWVFMVTYVAMFGMMFGDVGHGLVIAAGGWLFRRRLRGYAAFVVASGLASAAFGLIYGSVFGYHVLPAIWRSPLSAPMSMLMLAIGVGVTFIVAATAVTVRNQLVQGLRHQALYDGTGIAGLVLYLVCLWLVYQFTISQGFPHPAWLAAVLVPLGVILGYQWQMTSGPGAERVLVTLIQAYEAVIGYLVNTLSFLRLAAFALNHAALAMAVFTLAKMMTGAGSVLVILLGNLVILILEGGIVAIQALRLEYYEGFSRFFSGDGQPYRPLALNQRGRSAARGS